MPNKKSNTPPSPHLRGDEAAWIKDCTRKISDAFGGGSELFSRHGDEFRLDIDFVCKRIVEARDRHRDAMFRAARAERGVQPNMQSVWDEIGTALALLDENDASQKARSLIREALENSTGCKAPQHLGGSATPLNSGEAQ